MATITTGQITIIDQNDAKPITAFIGANGSTQQVYTNVDDVITYVPSWSVSSPLILTAYVYVGNANNIAGTLTNRKWSTSVDGTSIGSDATLNITSNITTVDTAPSVTYYFQGTYTDPSTNISSLVLTSIIVSVVKTGANGLDGADAAYIITRGKNAIGQAVGSVKNVGVIAVDLVRATGIDTTNLTYKWYDNNGSTQITAASANYGFISTAAGTNPALNVDATDLNTGTPGTSNTIIIKETAIQDFAVFKVEITDSVEEKSYVTFFTVYDYSDPYMLELVSTAGDKLQNGLGTTTVYPRVFNGSTELQPSDYQSWEFHYYFYDKDSKRGAFIDATKTNASGGRTIESSTAADTATGRFTITLSAALAETNQLIPNNIVKLIKSDGTAEYYEVSPVSLAAGATYITGTTITLKYTGITSGNSFLSWTTAPTLNAFKDGKFFICVNNNGKIIKVVDDSGINTVSNFENAVKIQVGSDEIDGKGTIVCEAYRP